MKKTVSVLLAFLLILSLGGCAKAGDISMTAFVSEDTKFGNAELSVTQEEFEKVGFRLGDSCDIEFENGYRITDVPYYNGYYVKSNAPVIVAYPGLPYIIITYNLIGIWEIAQLSEHDSVTVRLREAGKYASVYEALGQSYSFEYEDYSGSEQFCNFRALTGGDLKDGFLFRGASPVDNSCGRAPYTDRLLEAHGIDRIIDLADSEEEMQGYLEDDGFGSSYTAGLYVSGRIALLDMGASYQSETYRQSVAEGMKAMLSADGPVYIHCLEGKDRTGFVCTLLEALAGAGYEEMCADYMRTYECYYSISAEKDPGKYQAIVELYFDPFLAYLHGTEDTDALKNAVFIQDAADYLIAGGMTPEETGQLRALITK